MSKELSPSGGRLDIGIWLRGLGLRQYEQVFHDNDIDIDLLHELTDADLRTMGVDSLGHRKRLLRAIVELRGGVQQEARPPPPAASPAETGRSLAQAGTATGAERRQLTVAFVDLVGSTALSGRLDPEDMREVIRAYQDAVADGVVRFAGHIAKFMGDGVLAYFGWPVAHEDEAERAVRAGLAAVEAVDHLRAPSGDPLKARVGIATGLVVVGDLIGEGAAQEQAVVGETPNLAARLQQLAAPGEVVLAQATRRLLGDLFALDDLGPQTVKGIDTPVRAFRVLGEGAAESRFEALHPGDAGPLVGREQELALLLDRWRLAGAGEGQVVLLAGEPGIGKSRLVLALRERVRDEPRIRVSYSCSPHHVTSALWPIAEQLRRAAGFARDDAAEVKLAKLERLLGQAGAPADEAAATLAELLGLPSSGRGTRNDLTPQQKKGQAFAALLAQLEGLARQRPVLLILEDAHWLDPTSRELFDGIVDRIRSLPVLLVATFRPEAPPPWSTFPHVTLLSLNRLARAQAAKLVERVADGRLLPAAVAEVILSRTEGVPLFVEELTKAVLESVALRATSDGSLELAGSLPTLAIPATLQDSLMARLDRLAPVKEVAQAAACIGREFDHALLAAVAEAPEPELANALERLLRAGLVFRHSAPPEATYSFKHALVRDAAYATLLKPRRRWLHARIADALEAIRPQTGAYQPEILAYHLTEAGLPGRAAVHALAAGRLAKARHALLEARSQLEACLQLAAQAGGEAESATRAATCECLLLLADLASVDENLERANDCYDRAATLADDEAGRALARSRRHRLGYAHRDGARLAFYDHGSGEPAIVFVNPIVYGLATFQPILERLCPEFRVITVDGRGVGRSDPLVGPYGIARHAEDLRVVIEAAGAAPIVGVGISRGSNQLLHLTHKHPELIAKLMIVGTPPGNAALEGKPFYNPDYVRRMAEAYERQDADALIRQQAEFIYTEENTTEFRQMFVERCRRLPQETILRFYNPDPDMTIAPILGSITAPTLVAHGREDRIVDFAAAEYIAARLPGSRVYTFEGKGHSPMFSATEEFCTVLRSFVRT